MSVIILVTVLIGLVAIVILVAAILNICLKRRNKAAQACKHDVPSAYGLGQGTIVIKPARGPTQPAQVSEGVFLSHKKFIRLNTYFVSTEVLVFQPLER